MTLIIYYNFSDINFKLLKFRKQVIKIIRSTRLTVFEVLIKSVNVHTCVTKLLKMSYSDIVSNTLLTKFKFKRFSFLLANLCVYFFQVLNLTFEEMLKLCSLE